MKTSENKKRGQSIAIKVEVGACSPQGKAQEIANAFRYELSRLEQQGITSYDMTTVGCRGLCYKAPLVEVTTPIAGSILYQRIKPVEIAQIVREHILNEKPVRHLEVDRCYQPFFSKQERRVLRNCGEIDPCDIEAYKKRGGYAGLEKAIMKMKPEDVLKEIKDSQLRNRDSQASYTAEQLDDYRKETLHPKYLTCRGEGESSEACVTLALMEGDPFSIIEGMTILAYCIPGVTKGYIVHDSKVHPLVLKRMENAIKTAREKGYLGERIMGFPFEFNLELKASEDALYSKGDYAFCKECAQLLGTRMVSPGEREALFEHDADSTDQPDSVFTAETFATIPLICAQGSAWFKAVGTADSRGTKVFPLVGNVNQPGLVEVAYGTTLAQILELLTNDPHAVKAFILGGLGSAFLPKDFLNLPLTHSALENAGSGVGSGRILIIDQQHSIFDITRYAVEKEINRSPGSKLPCSEVLKTILLLLNKVPSGLTPGDLLILKNTAESLMKNARCDSVRLTSSPILSGLKYFEEEFIGHHSLERAQQLS